MCEPVISSVNKKSCKDAPNRNKVQHIPTFWPFPGASVKTPLMNLQSKFGNYTSIQFLNIALYMWAGQNYRQTDGWTDRGTFQNVDIKTKYLSLG